MELVYLWVEEYKNIKRQGFNFSPRFKCNYDENTNELTINENKDYVSIFPKNINVTAIVGENGSGKSSIIFQDENRGQGFTSNFKIIFENNRLILFEPFKEFWDDDGPYIKKFNIKNNTNFKHKLRTVYDYLKINSKDKQYFTSKSNGKSLDEEFSLYFNWDILKYFFKDEYYETYSYGVWKENKNILIPLIVEESHTISYKYFLNNVNTKILNFIKKHEKEAICFFEKFNFKILKEIPNEHKIVDIFDLSHGERYQFLLFFIILDKCFDKNKNLIIYLDEPDLTLHPRWQKKFIKKCIEVFSLFPYQIHIIIASHSPFILSDLPKKNVIFLEKGKQVDVDINTFGANIHTLLSHGFFMSDGLMGKFAKEKIQSVIDFLNHDNNNQLNQQKALAIIQLIGEPILKNKLLKMYEKKFHIKSKDEEIVELKAEIERLKNDKN